MDGIRELLQAVLDRNLASGHLRGMLHIAIGRKITKPDGSVVSTGVTWRELAGLLKLLRFDKDLVEELGVDPESLAPRDRQRFWYSTIALARVDSPEAMTDAEHLIAPLAELGFVVGPAPTGTAAPPSLSTPAKSKPAAPKPAKEPAKEPPKKPGKKGKKE